MSNVFGDYGKWFALAVFIIASLTDMLDGQIARRKNMITTFGKFMDPLADKLLVCSAMICFVALNRLAAWIVIIIIGREFIISGFRLIAAEKGIVIAAGWWGKFKTAFQMFAVILLIADIDKLWLLTQILVYIALALTIISLVDYLVKNKDVMKDVK
jgi:CDP-diacylglycerol--glycerol-3-phosphate 3-phosphatidyltransferase